MPPILPTLAPRSSDTNIGALHGETELLASSGVVLADAVDRRLAALEREL
jgi:hypothetical protein